MSEKKLIDDYYSKDSQDSQSQGIDKKEDIKPKIKGKIKIKPKKDIESNTPKKEDIKPKKEDIKVGQIPLNIKKDEPKKETFGDRGDKKESRKPFFRLDNKGDNRGNNRVSNRGDNRGDNRGGNNNSKPDFRKNTGEVKKDKPFKSTLESPTKTEGKDIKKDNGFKFPKKKFKIGNEKVKTQTGEDDFRKKGKFIKKDKSSKYFKQRNFLNSDDDLTFTRSTKIKQKEKVQKNVEDIKQNIVDRKGETVILGDILSVKELSEKIGIPLIMLIADFMKNGMKVTINSKVDFDTANIIADTFGIKVEKDLSTGLNIEDLLSGNISDLLKEDNKENLKERASVVSIMGHVDHGKTSLLDHIRKSKIADKEAGGITQSIGAYQVETKGKKITFLDTPGHEAFTVMRARGAKSTDIAILVVAADEGVKPQTIESINHAREAGIPIVVAINKMDKEGANPDNIKTQLSSHGLAPEDWGGDIPMVPVSAMTGFGIDDLLDILLIVGEMLELKANPNRSAVGTVIESHLDTKLGPVCTALINTGTINKGDYIVCKGASGRVKVLKDFLSKNITKAGPSEPVLLVGFDGVVEGGDIIEVVSSAEIARSKSLDYKELMASKKSMGLNSLDMIMSKIKSGSLKQLKIVVKSDTNGSLEALQAALLKLSTPETKVTIIHSGVGNITESDIIMCQGSSALLVGYNVDVLGGGKSLIESTKVEYIHSKVIYHITERIEKIVTGMLDPKEIDISLGEAKVGGIFYEDKDFSIIGLKLGFETKIENNCLIRVVRGNKLIGKGKVENLKSGVEDVNILEGPVECGIKFVGDTKILLGDVLELHKIEIQK